MPETILSPEAVLTARPAVEALRRSPIREIANAGMGKADLVAFWFGEPDEVTPEFIRRAGMESIAAGETFYTHNLGIPPLREALAAYISRLHRPTPVEQVAVTSSGMSGVQILSQALLHPGDRVVVITPEWPNVVETPKIMGACVSTVPLSFGPEGWSLDLDRLLDALSPDTVALFVNSPNNPTGWTMNPSERDAILAHCRRHGIWIVSDDAYERLYYDGEGAVAPSFLDVAGPEERVVSANTFSKSWLMTGWRLGWMLAPEPLMPALGKLIEYNTSCAPVFVQRAGVAAITGGEPVIARTVQRFRDTRDFLVHALNQVPGVHATRPDGAMYVFFRIDGMTESFPFCRGLVKDAGLGLAPGVAFGPEGEGFVRWCFAATPEKLAEGTMRLRRALQSRPR